MIFYHRMNNYLTLFYFNKKKQITDIVVINLISAVTRDIIYENTLRYYDQEPNSLFKGNFGHNIFLK